MREKEKKRKAGKYSCKGEKAGGDARQGEECGWLRGLLEGTTELVGGGGTGWGMQYGSG